MNAAMFDGKFKYSSYVPFDPTLNPALTGTITASFLGGVQPFEYTGWRQEMESWHSDCYLHGGLNPTSTYVFKGPDALRFLRENSTNGYKVFGPGSSRHAVFCSEDGLLMNDGMIMCTADDEFYTTWELPYIEWAILNGGYDIKGENVTGDVFIYQLGGPRSLEVIERATGENFHDLKFTKHRVSHIDGMEVRIIRMGMCGTLAYEVHGKFEDSLKVYDALWKAGQDYGMHKLGRHAYWNAHTEGGFPQAGIHFPYAWETNKEFFDYLQSHGGAYSCGSMAILSGSYSNKLEDRYVNPYELGWGQMVNFNHDFVGKDALMKIRDSAHREMVTLEWDEDDISRIWKSEFQEGQPYAPMDGPEDYLAWGGFEYRLDQVLSGGTCVGQSSGRIMSWHYRKMLSLASVKPEFAKEGTKVSVLWGDPGTRQIEIGATVARFPYVNEDRNETVDVSTVPSGIR